MRKWIRNNLRNIIIASFVAPILLVALVSIGHVTTMYGLTNPISWALYLSVGVEVAALSALAALSVRMGKFVYFPFIIVTLIQFLGNMYSSYSFIDVTSESFLQWIGFISPLVTVLGLDPEDMLLHKRLLAFFTGGLLPFISLTFVHMLVVFSSQNVVEPTVDEAPEVASEPPVEIVIPEPEVPTPTEKVLLNEVPVEETTKDDIVPENAVEVEDKNQVRRVLYSK